MQIIPLFSGFPGSSDRGFLGWSSCVLLKGEENYLFDTCGFNERYVLLERLRLHGLQPGDISAVFLSHFHFDHAVNYRLFPNAALYLHDEELRYAQNFAQQDLAIPAEMLSDLQATGRLELLTGDQGVVRGVKWLLSPGHTAGLYALEVEQDGRTVVLASDAVKNINELRTGSIAMAWSQEASERTIKHLISRADLILPGHDRLVEITRSASGQASFQPRESSPVRIRLAPGVLEHEQEWEIGL